MPAIEYIVDTGMAPAQRCQACNKRFWVERKPKEICPKCGGKLVETEERRRAIKAGFALAKEAQAAMAKVMVAVEEKTYVAPTKLTRPRVPDQGVAAGHQVDDPPDHLPFLRAARQLPHRAAHRLATPREGSGPRSTPSTPSSPARASATARRGLSPRTVHHVHTCLHRAFRDAVRWNRLFRNPVDAADPPKVAGPGGREMKTWDARRSGPSSRRPATTASTPSGVCWR